MKKKLKKLLLCLTLISILSIGTVSAKMFGRDCAYNIDFDSSGNCTITITKTTYVFWVPFSDGGSVYSCDWGLTVDQLCN